MELLRCKILCVTFMITIGELKTVKRTNSRVVKRSC